jgi:DNA processing protein
MASASAPVTPSALTPEAELCWLALRLVPGLGTRRSGQLLERFGSPQTIFRTDHRDLEAVGINSSIARTISSGCTFEDAATQQELMRKSGTQLLTLGDARYPERLRDIFDPPPVLFARGNIDLLASVCLGVVGTRHPTTYGVAASERLAGDLARAGLTIVSGMARGIDTASHRACLAAGGNTVAVLGCGVDVVYPSENRKLAAEIAAKGLIISEFPMESTAFPQNFPIRNRIISGLSTGILVIEGAQYSGSGITAKLALDQGREVFAVPGNITNKMSWGPNLLIKQGARLVQDWNDVVVDLPQVDQRRLIAAGRQRILALEGGDAPLGNESPATDSASNQPEGQFPEPQARAARRVLQQLKTDSTVHLDTLVDAIGDMSPSEIIASLFELEILGLVRQQPGRNFAKVW